jgi:5-methylcytosine-specific restriction endonuclease McrA
MANYRDKSVNGRLMKRFGNRYVEYVDKRTLYEAYGRICAICLDPLKFREMTIDHILPISLGGEHSYANTQPAHGLCNHLKGNTPDELIDVDAIKSERTRRRLKRRKLPYYNTTGQRAAPVLH